MGWAPAIQAHALYCGPIGYTKTDCVACARAYMFCCVPTYMNTHRMSAFHLAGLRHQDASVQKDRTHPAKTFLSILGTVYHRPTSPAQLE
eukprot:3008311-Karenia_brevis.AAC.1